jgi:hypothetical protein
MHHRSRGNKEKENIMSPPSADPPSIYRGADEGIPTAITSHEPDLPKSQVKPKALTFPAPPKFNDPYDEREYQKGRLALAFRIFAKLGFDEGVAGHITLRVSLFSYYPGNRERRANCWLG